LLAANISGSVSTGIPTTGIPAAGSAATAAGVATTAAGIAATALLRPYAQNAREQNDRDTKA
jgi:hypothetical protein